MNMQHLQFEALFNHATVGIILCNERGEIINFNAHAEQQFGYAAQEVMGKKIELLIPHRYHHSHVKDRERYFEEPAARVMGHGRDLHALKKNGTEFPVEVSLSTYRSDLHTFVIAFVVDITVRKKNEDEIRQLNQELERKVEARTRELELSKKELVDALAREKELGEMKTAFVTMASHEFRTPLSTILSSAFLLSKYRGEDDKNKYDKHISRIRDAVGSMKSILEDFLSLGKLEQGHISVNMLPFTNAELNREMDSLVEEMQLLAKKDQRIVIGSENNDPYMTAVDMALTRNILMNLLSNAIKFSGEGGRIVLEWQRRPGIFVITVSDNGIGIADADKHRLFEKFFRAANAVNIQGTGLGLHIVAGYVRLMNGTITVESELEKGTTVTITIPQQD